MIEVRINTLKALTNIIDKKETRGYCLGLIANKNYIAVTDTKILLTANYINTD